MAYSVPKERPGLRHLTKAKDRKGMVGTSSDSDSGLAIYIARGLRSGTAEITAVAFTTSPIIF